jgi:hypothetical protein
MNLKPPPIERMGRIDHFHPSAARRIAPGASIIWVVEGGINMGIRSIRSRTTN